MQDDTGLRRALTGAWTYDVFQHIVGAHRLRRWLVNDVWRVQPDDTIVDVGCGTGKVVEYLPACSRYVGIDISAPYIERARRRYGQRAEFVLGTARTVDPSMLPRADLVTTTGLLHHLDDKEARDVFRFAARVLRPGGRVVCVEPTFLAHQTAASQWWMRRDRGRNVRRDDEWGQLARPWFPCATVRVVTGLLRVPYIHVVIEGQFESVALDDEISEAADDAADTALGAAPRR